MQQKYQAHRAAFLDALLDAQMKYGNDVIAGLESGEELLSNFSATLEQKGSVRLFKYQPFSEQNLQDCESGVLHLSKPADLNDINEGRPIFDKAFVEQKLSSIDAELVSKVDQNDLPVFISDAIGNSTFEQFGEAIQQLRESGALETSIAPRIAGTLQSLSGHLRDFELCGSLSATGCSSSMWDRYGDKHRGFVAGYTIDAFTPEFTISRTGSCTYGFRTLLAPVFYGERLELSFNSSAALIANPEFIGATNMQVLYLALSLLQKTREWEWEQEWRVIAHTCKPGIRVHYCRMKPDSVYLGLRMQEDEKRRLISAAARNGWRVFEMKVSDVSIDGTLDMHEIVDS